MKEIGFRKAARDSESRLGPPQAKSAIKEARMVSRGAGGNESRSLLVLPRCVGWFAKYIDSAVEKRLATLELHCSLFLPA